MEKSAQIHLSALFQRRPELTVCQPALEQAFMLLLESFKTDHKLLLCGNGGSAADCEHWAGELLKGFCARRPVPHQWREKLGDQLATHLQCALPAIPLTGFLSASTAFANDVDPSLVFAQLVWALGRPGDVIVGISTSGNAKNVLKAFNVARAMNIKTIALTGRDGGALAPLADVALRVPADVTLEIQELHLPIYHALSRMLEDTMFSS